MFEFFSRCCCCLPLNLGQNLIGALMTSIFIFHLITISAGAPQTAWKNKLSIIDVTMWILITICMVLFIWEKVRTWADRNTENVRYNRFAAMCVYVFANTIKIWIICAFDWKERGLP